MKIALEKTEETLRQALLEVLGTDLKVKRLSDEGTSEMGAMLSFEIIDGHQRYTLSHYAAGNLYEEGQRQPHPNPMWQWGYWYDFNDPDPQCDHREEGQDIDFLAATQKLISFIVHCRFQAFLMEKQAGE